MKILILPLFALALSGHAHAESSPASGAEKSLFDQSSPHVAEFLVKAQTETQAEKIESAFSLLEQNRPAKMRYDVINEGSLLKVETSQATDDKAAL